MKLVESSKRRSGSNEKIFTSSSASIDWWLIPFRGVGEFPPLDFIQRLIVRGPSERLCSSNYFSNVHHLLIYDLDDHIAQWLQRCVNLTKVKSIDISECRGNSFPFSSLWKRLPNLRSVRMAYKQILANADDPQIENPKVTRLDVVGADYTFNEFDMSFVAIVFPNVEYLQVTSEFYVSMWAIHPFQKLRLVYQNMLKLEPEYRYSRVSLSRNYKKTWLGSSTFREHEPLDF